MKPGIREGAEEPTPQALQIHETVERALESYAPRPEPLGTRYEGHDACADRRIRQRNQRGGNHLAHRERHRLTAVLRSSSSEVSRLSIGIERDRPPHDGNRTASNYDTLIDFPPDKFPDRHLAARRLSSDPFGKPPRSHKVSGSVQSMVSAGLLQYAQLYSIPWRHAEDGRQRRGDDEGTGDASKNIGTSGYAVTGPRGKVLDHGRHQGRRIAATGRAHE